MPFAVTVPLWQEHPASDCGGRGLEGKAFAEAAGIEKRRASSGLLADFIGSVLTRSF